MRGVKLPGEYLDIDWDCGDVSYYFRGHVSTEDCVKNYALYSGTTPTFSGVKHQYARWVPVQGRGYDISFELADGPGRGAFKVTEAIRVPDPADREPTRYFAQEG